MKIFRFSRDNRGTTLIELMIALILTGIVVMSVMKLYATQHENYIIQDDVSNMQQSARACIDELTRQIRMAGHNLPLSVSAIEAYDTDPDTVTVTYHGNECETFLSVDMANEASAVTCNTDVSCFSVDQWVYIYDPDSSLGEWFQISSINAGTRVLQPSLNLDRAYDADALVVALNRLKFYIDNSTNPDKPTLMVQFGFGAPVAYAEDISDLQFQYRLANGSIVDVPVLVSDVREVLIELTAQSLVPEFDNDGNSIDFDDPEAPDRKGRTYTSSVSLRNVGV